MKSPTSKIKLEIQAHCALLTLSNPPANTWDLESLGALPEIIASLSANKNIYSLILRGEGEKFFSAGADLKVFQDGNKNVAKDMSDKFGAAFEALRDFRGLSIAAIHGYAMGGGLEAALACDLRIAESHAQLALPEASVGLLPCAGGTQNLAWLVGEAWAKRLILCGERISAETALRIGLVEEVVEKGQAQAKAFELAQKLERQSPTSVTACKKLIQQARFGPQAKALPLEREMFVELFNTQDQKEGVQAFLEKRPAQWKNA